jgi:lon-related putative ATP-dependent protease
VFLTTPDPLPPEALRFRIDPEQIPWETTDAASLPPGSGIPDQPRATAALELGTTISREGFNVFVMGMEGSGRHHLVLKHLEDRAIARPVPPDLCYVHNFDEARRPSLLTLPPGRGPVLREEMDRFSEDLPTVVESAFESEEYHARRDAIETGFATRGERSLQEVRERAEGEGLVLLRTPAGLAFAPARDGEVISEEDYAALPEEERKELEARIRAHQEDLQKRLRQFPRWDRERRSMVRELNREVTELAVGQLLEEVRQKHQDLPQVLSFLDAVQKDVGTNPRRVVQPDRADGQEPTQDGNPWASQASVLRRYRVNVLVRNEDGRGAPVVHEDNPTFENLVGRTEHLSRYMNLVTDFSLIRPGALHRANGGYLVLEARKVLQSPFAWDALKRILRSRRIRIESPGEGLGLATLVTLEPEPVPLDLRVILIGDHRLFHLLMALDPEFGELFKLPADFDHVLPAGPEGWRSLALLVADIARSEGLLPVHRDAVGRILEESHRWAGHRERLSARIGWLADLVREASHRAESEGAGEVRREHVSAAVEAAVYRSDRIRERMLDEIRRGTILLDLEGSRAGQVNGLSVISLGRFAFGRPSRITARVRLGNGTVVDIEREVEMGGPIHSKGVLILSGYLGARYSRDRPLSLFASLVFEQSYSGVEGDSASAAELLALLSAVSGVPLRQDLAVTGSVNQHGEIQPVGGVTEKVEGFFDTCRLHDLTGRQGVLIPQANVQHLLLREDVAEAAAAGDFHVIPVSTVDQVSELLTGMPAGERDDQGTFPEGSFNRRVEERLAELAERSRRFRLGDRKDNRS